MTDVTSLYYQILLTHKYKKDTYINSIYSNDINMISSCVYIRVDSTANKKLAIRMYGADNVLIKITWR